MAKELTADTPILLVQEETAEKNNLKVVKGLDRKGNLQTVDPEKAKQGDFLTIDKSGNFLENFFKNFIKQADDPKHMGVSRSLYKFYVVTYGMLKDAVNMTSEQLEKFRVKPEEYVNQKKEEELKKGAEKLSAGQPAGEVKQNPGEEPEANNNLKNDQTMEQQQEKNGQPQQDFKQFDVSRIAKSEYEKLGITPESVEGYLNQMSWGFKSKDLIDLKPRIGDTEISVKALLSIAEQADGSLSFKMHPYQEKVDVSSPFQGIILPDDVQKSLLETGHSGKTVNLEPEAGKIVPSLISVDYRTNRLEAVPVESLSFKKVLGVDIPPDKQEALKRGEKVFVEGMTSKRTGKVFNDDIRFNAAKGQLDFSLFAAQNRQEQNRNQSRGQGELKARKVGEVWVRPVQGGVSLSKEQFENVCKKEAVWIEGLERKPKQQPKEGMQQTEAVDKKGHKYNAWVWIDAERGHVRHTGKHPSDLKAGNGKEIKPAAGYETQTAVNNQGKTNEATKHVKEPLQKGQIRPTEKQAEKKEQQEEAPKKIVKKNKGVKM